MKNYYPRKGSIAVFGGVVCLVCAVAYPAEQFPYMGTVTSDRVNVRAGSSLNHEILCKVNKGDRVAVRGERGGWLKIVPPPPVRVWIWGELVEDDVVMKDAVNVRARPSLRSGVLCQVNKGDEVRALDMEGEWLGIAPPADCYAWVSAGYVEFGFPITPVVEDESEKLFNKYEARLKVFKPDAPGSGRELYELIAGYKRVIAGGPDGKLAKLARMRVDELERMKRKRERGEPTPGKKPAAKERVVRRCSATGIVKRLDEPLDGATHLLLGKRLFSKKIMCYLRAPLINLDVYAGQKVSVSGIVLEVTTGGVPVVEVRSVVLD